jgi:diguanylate cyclase (GGDEF)-like protein/PAS domain S-box-containing protein
MVAARDAAHWVMRTHDVLAATDEIRNALAAADATQRAFLQVGSVMDDYRAPGDHLGEALAGHRALTRENLDQQRRLDTLEQLMEARLGELSATAGLARRGLLDSARAVARSAESAQRAERMHQLLRHIADAEHASLRERIADHILHADRGRLYVSASLVASLLLVGVGVSLLRRAERRAHTWARQAQRAAATARAAEASLRESEAAARRSESRFRAALDAMLDGFLIARPISDATDGVSDFDVVEANAVGAAFFGMRREALVGARIGTLPVPNERAASLLDVCRRVLATGEPHVADYRLIGADAATVWVHLQVVPAVEGIAMSCQDITARKHAEAVLADLAGRDELTGLLNRRGFRRATERQLEHAHRQGRNDALLALDLNGFKAINDTYGHPEGDAALREVARILRAALRETDLIARFGGDEFVVYTPDGGAQAASFVARVHAAFVAANDAAIAVGRPYRLETSIGVAVPSGSDDLDMLLERADRALYRQKAPGRGRAA